MTAEELRQLCIHRPEEFTRILQAACQVLPKAREQLAEEFEVARSTVSRWANGVTKPNYRIRQQVVESIRRRTYVI